MKKNISRKLVVVIARMRSNHYNLSASLARVNIVPSPKYKCNQEVEDLNHVFWQCKLYDEHKQTLIKDLKKLAYRLPLCVDLLIAKPDIRACSHMLTFLNSCNLNII